MRRHAELSLKLAALAAGMFAFGFALVPLYAVFCDLTGLGGKTVNEAAQVAESIDATRTVRLEFLATSAPGAPWEFRPAVSSMEVHPGQIVATAFAARNLSDTQVTAQAVPSVAPGLAAQHFRKIECFCFTQQAFEPREGRDLGVRFLIDPLLPAHIDTLTLAYTLYAVPQ